MEKNNANEHNMVKNPNWQEADHLAIYKRCFKIHKKFGFQPNANIFAAFSLIPYKDFNN